MLHSATWHLAIFQMLYAGFGVHSIYDKSCHIFEDLRFETLITYAPNSAFGIADIIELGATDILNQ